MTNNQLQHRDPTELRLHPLVKELPGPVRNAAWNSFKDALMLAGPDGIPPLLIAGDIIMDGARRWQAAKELQWPEIRCEQRPLTDAALLIVDSLLGQHDLPRGTKVYRILKLLPEWSKSAESRRLAGLRHGSKTGQNPNVLPKCLYFTTGELKPESVPALADRMGVSRETVFRAQRVAKLFEKHPEFRADYEADLLTGEISLWNVESGIKGALADQTTRDASKEKSQLELFGDAFTNLKTASKNWSRFSKENREAVLRDWRETIDAMPEAFRSELIATLEEAE